MKCFTRTARAVYIAAILGAAVAGWKVLSDRGDQAEPEELYMREVEVDTLFVSPSTLADAETLKEATGWRVSIERFREPAIVSLDSIAGQAPLAHLNQPRKRYSYDLVHIPGDSVPVERVMIETYDYRLPEEETNALTYDTNPANLIPSTVTTLIDLNHDNVPDLMHRLELNTGETSIVRVDQEGRLTIEARNEDMTIVQFTEAKMEYAKAYKTLFPLSQEQSEGVAMLKK